jgi:hypothetical protein
MVSLAYGKKLLGQLQRTGLMERVTWSAWSSDALGNAIISATETFPVSGSEQVVNDSSL